MPTPRRDVLDAGERRRRGRRRRGDARLPRDPARDARARRGRCRPGLASRAGRCGRRSPVIVPSEWPTKSSIAPSSPTAAASVSDPEQRACRTRARARASASGAAILIARLLADDGSVLQLDRALEPRGDVGVVGRDDEREAELALQRLDQVEHALARVRVEVPGRLVAEQQLRLLRERARDRDALRLAARELGRQVVRLRGEPDELEQLLRCERRLAGEVRGEGDVLERGEVRQQVRALEDVGDPVRAHRAARRAVERGERPAVPLDDAAGRLDEAAEHVQQRRLARAGAAEQREALARPDLEVDAGERVHGRRRPRRRRRRRRGTPRAPRARPASRSSHDHSRRGSRSRGRPPRRRAASA